MPNPIRETTDITGFHVHVYFDEATSETAARLREEIMPRFAVEVGRWHARPMGPHPKGMYQLTFDQDQFAAVVSWLMLNRDGLSILVHPMTGDEVADHATNLLWLGEPLPLDLEFMRRYVERRKMREARAAVLPWGVIARG